MKIVRLIFYVVSVLVIGEVTEVFSLYKKSTPVCFYSDLGESPLEEDESRVYEEDDDYFIESLTLVLYPIQTISVVTPSLYFELTEPLHEITVPPPQG